MHQNDASFGNTVLRLLLNSYTVVMWLSVPLSMTSSAFYYASLVNQEPAYSLLTALCDGSLSPKALRQKNSFRQRCDISVIDFDVVTRMLRLITALLVLHKLYDGGDTINRMLYRLHSVVAFLSISGD